MRPNSFDAREVAALGGSQAVEDQARFGPGERGELRFRASILHSQQDSRDLGFDAGALGDVLGDISSAAGDIASAASAALDAVDKLKALASLGSLGSVGNPVKPLADQVGSLQGVAESLGKMGKGLLE